MMIAAAVLGSTNAIAGEVVYNNTTTDDWEAWYFSHASKTYTLTDTYATLTCEGYYDRGYIKTKAPVPQFTRLFFRAKQTGGYQYGYAVQYSETGESGTWHNILTGRAPTNELSHSYSSTTHTLTIDQIEIMHNVVNCDNCFPVYIE